MSLQFLRLSKRAIFGLTIALLMLAAQPAKAQWPDVVEAKRIAEEGFIYGLPIVMNYAVMYEYAVDRTSGQFKAPFNQINNEAPCLHLRGYGDCHAEQRHALLVRLAGPARRADRPLGAGSGEGPLLLGAARSTATPSTTATSAAAPPATRRATTWSPVPIGRARRRRASRRCSAPARSSRSPSIAPSSSIPPTCRTSKRSRPATRCSRFRLSSAARAARGADDRFPEDRHGRVKNELLRVSRLRAAIRARQPTGGQGYPRQARQHRRRSRQDLRLQGPLARAQGRRSLLGMKDGDEKIEQVPRQRQEDHQWLEHRLVLRRPRLLQRRLAEAGRRAPRPASTATTPSRRCIP